MISLLLPIRGRVEKLKEVIAAISETVAYPENIEVIIKVDDDDSVDYSFNMPSFCRVKRGPRPESKFAKFNEVYRMATGDIIMPLNDDSYFISHGWDEIIEKEFAEWPDKILLLYGRDGVQDERLATHYIISRKMADALGYFCPPFLKAYFADNFMHDLAVRIRRIKYDPRIVIDHRAAHVGKGEKDETFLSSIGFFQEDRGKYITSVDEMNQAVAILNRLKTAAGKYGEFKLGIGIPCDFPMVPIAFFQSMMTLGRPDFELLMADNGHLDNMRNDIVRMAQVAKCTHLILMDTDMIYHPQTITQLLSHRLPIVGTLTFRRYPPFDPLLLMRSPETGRYSPIEEWDEGSLVEVDATGTGCLMFDMEVFSAMPFPWFQFRKNLDGSSIGEDIGFCQDLKAAEYKIFVDTAVPSKHLTTFAVDLNTHNLYKAKKAAQLRQIQKQGG